MKSLLTVTAAIKLKMFVPWKDSYDKLTQHIKKQRHHFSYKGPNSQSYGFSSSHAQMWSAGPYRRLSAEDMMMLLNCGAGEARRSNQSILKEINPDCSFEGLMVKLKLQYFGHLIQKVDSLEKTLLLGKIEGKRRRELQRMRWLYSITNSVVMNLRQLRKVMKDRGAWCAAIHGGHKESDMTWRLNSNKIHLKLKPNL